MKRYLAFLLIAWSCSLFAQVTQADFINGVPPELKRISKKLIIAAREGRVPAYITDSLNRAASAEEAHQLGGKLVVVQKQNWRYPTDPTDLIDTAWFEIFNPDSTLANLAFNYEVSSSLDPAMKFRAVAPLYEYKIAKMVWEIPQFWIKVADLSKVLSPAELEFLQALAWFRSFEHMAIRKVDLSETWNDVGVRRMATMADTFTITQIGANMTESLKFLPFEPFSTGKLKLYENGKTVRPDTFFNRHNRRIEVEDGWWVNTGDPVRIIDSVYFDPPSRFDSFQIVNLAGVTTIQYFQRNRRSQTIRYNRYDCPLEATWEYMHPAAWTLINSLVKLKEE